MLTYSPFPSIPSNRGYSIPLSLCIYLHQLFTVHLLLLHLSSTNGSPSFSSFLLLYGRSRPRPETLFPSISPSPLLLILLSWHILQQQKSVKSKGLLELSNFFALAKFLGFLLPSSIVVELDQVFEVFATFPILLLLFLFFPTGTVRTPTFFPCYPSSQSPQRITNPPPRLDPTPTKAVVCPPSSVLIWFGSGGDGKFQIQEWRRPKTQPN